MLVTSAVLMLFLAVALNVSLAFASGCTEQCVQLLVKQTHCGVVAQSAACICNHYYYALTTCADTCNEMGSYGGDTPLQTCKNAGVMVPGEDDIPQSLLNEGLPSTTTETLMPAGTKVDVLLVEGQTRTASFVLSFCGFPGEGCAFATPTTTELNNEKRDFTAKDAITPTHAQPTGLPTSSGLPTANMPYLFEPNWNTGPDAANLPIESEEMSMRYPDMLATSGSGGSAIATVAGWAGMLAFMAVVLML